MDSHKIANRGLGRTGTTTVTVMEAEESWDLGDTPGNEMLASGALEKSTDEVLIIRGRVSISF